MATAVKIISNQVRRGALAGAAGSVSVANGYGAAQMKLDLISNEVMIGETEWTGYLAAMASEEMEDIYPVPATGRRGKYLLVFDPLDGPGGIDASVSVVTISSRSCAAPTRQRSRGPSTSCSRAPLRCAQASPCTGHPPC